MKFKLASIHINWPDHLVGFFSALFGILIAFQLEEWRDQREREQLVQLALQNLKSEIDINKNYYEETTRFNETFLHFLSESSPNITEELTYSGSKNAVDSLNKFFPGHFAVDPSAESRKTFPLKITLNITVHHPLTAAWESAKATGALNFMNFEQVHLLSLIYHQEKLLNEIDNLNALIKNSGRIKSKSQLFFLVDELRESNSIIQREMNELKGYINILTATE
jgi:hypothetical protein